MQITVTIDEELFKAAAQSAVRAALEMPDSYRGSGGGGYQAIKKQVEAHIKQQDYTALIGAAVNELLADVLQDTVRTALREHIKRTIKTMKESGDFANAIEGGDEHAS